MRTIPGAVLLALAIASPALAQGGKVQIAKIYMAGDRIVEGEVTAEDDATITIKTDLAEAPFPKREILHVVRAELTPDELRARKKAKSVYTSLLLGYKLTKPDEWSFKFDPPEPLSDVLVRSKDEATISVFGIPDKNEDVALDDAALEAFSKTVEAKLKEKFVDVKRTTGEKSKFKDRPALLLEFAMKRKDGGKEFKQGELVFKSKGKVLFFAVWAPIAKYVNAKAAFDQVLGTVEFTEANSQEGDRLFSKDALFVLEKPSDWTFTKGSEAKGCEAAAPKNEAWLRVEPKKLEAAQSLDGWAKDAEPSLDAELSSAKKLSSGPANVCGRLGRSWVFAHEKGGEPRKRLVWLIRDQERGYQLTADVPADKKQYAPIVSEILSRFRILNSLLAEGALEKGLEAIDLYDQGDKKLDAKDYAGAMSLYEQATAVYPRYAAAFNNLGVAALRANDAEKARHAFQRAYDLFPEDGQVRGNLAATDLTEAVELLKARKGEDAIRLVERARSLAPADSEVHKDMLAAVYQDVAIYEADKESWSAAASWMEKALALRPKDQNLAKNMATICVNAAVTAFNKKNTSSAKTWANKALKYDPGNGKAKEVLEACKRAR